MKKNKKYQVDGYVKPGFENVMKQFESLYSRGFDKQSQCCIYVGNEIVLDVCGKADQPAYTADTLSCVFSSGKNLAAVLIAMMVDQGKLDYNEPVAKYWPEFAQGGKAKVTLADVMRHEAGLDKLGKKVEINDTMTEAIKANKLGKMIEEEPYQEYPEGLERVYHTLTRDWITNEIFRRVDDKKRTMHEYMKEEVQG